MLGFFHDNILGLEVAPGLRSDQPGQRWVGKGDEFNKAALAPPAPPQAPAVPALANVENGACPAYEPPMPPTFEGAEAGAGDLAPGEDAVPLPAASKPGCCPRMKISFHELIQIWAFKSPE